MSSEWPKVRLEEITTVLGDGLHGTPEYDDHGEYFFINGNNLSDGRIVCNEKTRRVSEQEYQKHKKKLNDRTILVSINGTLGNVALYRGEKVVLGKSACYFNVHDNIDKQFVRFVIESDSFQSYISNLAAGSTIKNVSLRLMRDFSFQLPSLEMQKEISSILAVLVDRITLLRETNTTLEAIAQALFKSWFVDFDPVRAKQEGREPEGMDSDTAAHFPDSFEESELGAVPKGWRVATLQDLLVLQRGFDLPTSDRVPGKFPIIAASGPSGTHNISMAKGPGVITGRSGVLGRVFLELDDYWPLNTALWIKEFRAATPCYAYELLRLLDFASFNAGSAVPTLNRNHVHTLKYLIPATKCIDAYEENAIKLHQRAKANREQAQTLATLRDTLLPRLISGQLRLPDAETMIGEAAA